MKKFSSSASLSNNNNCNSNSSSNSAKITSKLIANQITNDIIKPKAISAAEAKLKNTNKNYAKMSTDSNKTGGYKVYNRQEHDPSDYSMHLNEPSSSSIDVLSCVSTNSSSDSNSTLNVCEYLSNEATASSVAVAAISANCRKKSVVNDYATADYVMHRPKSSQSQHNPYKSPAEKKQHRKHYSAQGLRSQHTGSGPIYAKKHQHTKKPTHHHNHTHKQTAAQYTTHNLHMSSPPSPPPLRLPAAKKDRHS